MTTRPLTAQDLRFTFQGFFLGKAFYDVPSVSAYAEDPIEMRGFFAGASGVIERVWLRVDESRDFEGVFVENPKASVLRVRTTVPVPNLRSFRVVIAPGNLAPGRHFAILYFSSGPVQMRIDTVFTIDVHASVHKAEGETRILVAGAMKTGGRHVAGVLRRYYGIEANPVFSFESDGEQVLTESVVATAGERPFVLHCHPLARTATLVTCATHGVQVVPTWRNLGDVVVSMDEHFRSYPEASWRNVYMPLTRRDEYLKMPVQARYQLIIRYATWWFVYFYITWREVRQPLFVRYEWMAEDPFGFFRYVIGALSGAVDEERLQAVLAKGTFSESGLNVGKSGRSAELFSPETKAMLEDFLLAHPEDVHELWLELPWVCDVIRKPKIARSSGGDLYVYGGDRKHKIATQHWLATHRTTPADAVPMPDEQLAAYRDGAEAY